jgi:salicylate hydroxylase
MHAARERDRLTRGDSSVAASRTVIIAGAGIGGLVAALTLVQHGLRVILLEQAQRLEEVGAGIQLSPNASRILMSLGLEPLLRPFIVTPTEVTVMHARTARVLARARLGDAAEKRYGSPYWVIHRGDLQSVLVDLVAGTPDISLRLGTRVEDFASHGNGVTVATASSMGAAEERGLALICADGLWSNLRRRLGHRGEPRFAGYTAWRALVDAGALGPDDAVPRIQLWLGRHAHVVHYPVRGGSLVNVVAIIRDDWREAGWSAPGERSEILARYPAGVWPASVRAVLAAAENWRKWALFDRAPLASWGKGAVTLLGDAAHPMLPYLAQGAAAAIEDAAVLARRLADTPAEPERALRLYENERYRRTARIQRAARRNGMIYHMGGAEALLHALALVAMRGRGLLARYDWLYKWKPT